MLQACSENFHFHNVAFRTYFAYNNLDKIDWVPG